MSKSSETLAKQEAYCSRCGAKISATARVCWRCAARYQLGPNGEYQITREVSLTDLREAMTGRKFGIAGLLLFITLVSIVMAIFLVAPGLGILVTIFAIPAVIRTWMILNVKSKRGQATNMGAKAGLFLGSFAATVVIVFATAVVSLFGGCAATLAFAAVSWQGGILAIPVFLISTLGSGWLMLRLFSNWVRKRWKRDLGDTF